MNRTQKWLIALSLAASPACGLADNWPNWRGPRQNGVAEAQVPTTWGQDRNIAWSVPMEGVGSSCPVVWDDQVIVTSSTGWNDTDLTVTSYDLNSGAVRWRQRMLGRDTPVFQQFPPARGNAMPSPVTDGKRIVAAFSTGEIAAYSLAGEPLWFRSLQDDFGEIDNDYGLAGSPVLVEDAVLFPVDQRKGSYLIALDADSGQTLWKTDRPEVRENWTTPLIVSRPKGSSAVLAGTHQIIAFDVLTGARQWTVGGVARLCCPTPIPLENDLIVTSGPGGNVKRVGLGEGATEATDVWTSIKGAGFVPSGICVEGLYFYVNERGIATCLDLKDGSEVWTHRVGGSFRASPVAAGQAVYFSDLEGKTTVIRAARRFEVLGTNELGQPLAASPALCGDCLIFRTSERLVCIKDSSKKGQTP